MKFQRRAREVLSLRDGDKVAKMPQFHSRFHITFWVSSGNKHRLSQWRGTRRIVVQKRKEPMTRTLEATEMKQVRMPDIDKVVVVTGASSGIGESTARLLARHGAKVVLGARRKDRLDAAVKDISAAGGKAISVAVDVTKRAEVEALIRPAVDRFGRVDVMVNDAGIMAIAPIEALKVEEWDRMIDVNIKGLLYGVAAVLPIMQKQKQGHIINMSSVGGFKVWAPGGTVYSATKFAVRAITEGLRMEHKTDNIRCTII